jgi:hypothetical protein
MGTEPVDGINNFFQEQNKNGEYSATLITFNESSSVIFRNIKGSEIKALSRDAIVPNGMTALYDAIGKAINIQKEDKMENVIFLIVTDGQENASREFNRKIIKDLISEMESKHKWKFIYLGANQDSFAVGNSIGITTSADYEYTPLGCRKMMREVSDNISRCITGEVPVEKFELKVDQSFKKRKFDDVDVGGDIHPSIGGAAPTLFRTYSC